MQISVKFDEVYVYAIHTYFTTLIYYKALINNKTEQDTEQDTTYRYDKRSRMPTTVALYFEILINYYVCSEESACPLCI